MKTTPAMSGPASEPRPTCRCRGAHEWAGGKPPTEGCFYEPGPDLVRHGIPTKPESGGRRRAATHAPASEWVTVPRSLVEGAEHSLNGVGMTRVAGLLREALDAQASKTRATAPAADEDA